MATKYNRTNFLTKDKVNGINEYDLVSNSLNKFRFSNRKTYYKVTQEDIQRPDLIAIKAYQSREAMPYWFIIMYLNNIHDVWNDLTVGDVLLIPNEKDIEDFFIFNRSQQNATR